MKKYVSYITIILLMHNISISMDTLDLNRCMIPTGDHAEYITQQPDWPTLFSPFSPVTEGEQFKQAWLSSMAKKQYSAQQPEFLFGVSSSAYQIEGGLDAHNATAQFYRSHGLQSAGIAIDFWNKCEQDILQMKNELGITSFRFSVAWDRVQPQKDVWNENALTRYKAIVNLCKLHNIEPIITLHQYTNPIWFEQLSGFEKKENNAYFVEFAKKIYTTLCSHVTYWSTFNAPEAYAIKGYAKGENSPGEHDNWQKVEEVLANMLDAHVDIYQAIKGKNGLYHLHKEQSSIPNPQIGIQKNIIMLDTASTTWEQTCLSPVTAACCLAGNLLQNDAFYTFFNSGTINLWIPSKVSINHTNPLAPKSLDWIGINFYSNMMMVATKPQEETDPELRTENPRYRNYPEGIARAIEQIHINIAQPLNIPIIITENGIAAQNDEAGERKRERFFQRALFTIKILLQHGYNIIGYLPWSSHDSYEWPTKEFPEPFTKRLFGFFAVNQKTLERTLKKSSYYYRDFIKGYFHTNEIVND